MQKKPDDNVAQYKDRTDCAEDDVSDQIQLPFFWNGVGLVPNLSQFAQKLGVPLIVNSQLAAPINAGDQQQRVRGVKRAAAAAGYYEVPTIGAQDARSPQAESRP
jgi:hypothetical protein